MRYHSPPAGPNPHRRSLETEILACTRESLDAAGQECARSGHLWKELEPNTADGRPAAYCPIFFSVGAERELVLPVRTTTRQTGHALAMTLFGKLLR
jgi:hypothetical protein